MQYKDFVKENLKKAPAGMPQKDKMRWVAKQWAQHKAKQGGAGSTARAPSKALFSGGSAAPNRRRVMAPGGQAGGAVNPLGASTQIGGGFLSGLVGMLGLGVEAPPPPQEGEGIFDDIIGGIGKVAQVAAPFIPLLL